MSTAAPPFFGLGYGSDGNHLVAVSDVLDASMIAKWSKQSAEKQGLPSITKMFRITNWLFHVISDDFIIFKWAISLFFHKRVI